MNPAAFAAAEFKRRQQMAREAVHRGAMSRDAAEAHLLPWLAIAAAAGAELSELLYECQTYRPRPSSSSGAVGQKGTASGSGAIGQPERWSWKLETHRLHGFEISPAHEYRDVLAKARDAALNALAELTGRGGAEAAQPNEYARGMVALADALGCRPWLPRTATRIAA